MKIFIICPVREISEGERQYIANYILELEQQGHQVHWPIRDTNQEDITGGFQICKDNRFSIMESDEVHVYWNGKSEGSIFDLGIAFTYNQATNLPIKLINKIEPTKEKSFNNVLLALNSEYNQRYVH